MASDTFEDFDRLLRVLRDDPGRRAQLRAMVVDETLSGLTAAVERLTEAQTRTEQRLEALTQRVDALAERVDGLTQRVDELAAAQTRTEQRLSSLSSTVEQLTATTQSLVEQVSALTGHVDWLPGDAIERRYRERPHTYLSRVAHSMHLLSAAELDALLDPAVEQGVLTLEEADKIRAADGVFRGRRTTDRVETYVVLEASVGVGLKDVRRARERADLLALTGVEVDAVVGGTWVTPEAAGLAEAAGVWQVTDGRALPPAS